jgi:hypothetical protein
MHVTTVARLDFLPFSRQQPPQITPDCWVVYWIFYRATFRAQTPHGGAVSLLMSTTRRAAAKSVAAKLNVASTTGSLERANTSYILSGANSLRR